MLSKNLSITGYTQKNELNSVRKEKYDIIQKAFCGKIIAGKEGISMGHWKADSTVCDSGFGLVYVYNAEEMQQLNRPTDPVFYLPYVLQQRAVQGLIPPIDFRIAEPDPISYSHPILKVKICKTTQRAGSVTLNDCLQVQ